MTTNWKELLEKRRAIESKKQKLLDECEKAFKQCIIQMQYTAWNEEPIFGEMNDLLTKLRKRKGDGKV